jgi:triosephosphate isomerase (TIM)
MATNLTTSCHKTQRTPLVAGNWKMNMDHLQAIAFVQKLSWTLSDAKHDHSAVEVAIFPPFTDLRSVNTLIVADHLPLRYGAQDLSEHDSGAYTGEISGHFLSRLGCHYVIIGHSERRTLHLESDEHVGRKVAAAIRHALVPIICVGETAEDHQQRGPGTVPVAQLRTALSHLPHEEEGAATTSSPLLVVAYEPVWAIGTGHAASPEHVEEVAAQLRDTLHSTLGAQVAETTRILYGGSVKAANMAGFMRAPNIDGALVGGASLDVTEFASIVRYHNHIGT